MTKILKLLKYLKNSAYLAGFLISIPVWRILFRKRKRTPKDKIKLLCLSHSSELWGAERSLLLFLEHADRQELELSCVLPQEGPLIARLDQAGIPWTRLDLHPWRGRSPLKWILNSGPKLWQCLKVFLSFRPDCVYTNTAVIPLGAVVAKSLGVPHLWHIRESFFAEPVHQELNLLFSGETLLKMIGRLSDLIVTPSSKLKKEFENHGCQTPIEVVRNAFDPKLLTPLHDTEKEKFRQSLSIPGETPLIGMLGVYSYGKGPHIFLEMASDVLKEIKDITFILMGKACDPIQKTYFEQMQKKTREILPQGCVIWGPYDEDPRGFYSAIDILALPSLADTFPRTVMEAMAMGKVVVANKETGASEMIESGVTGILTPLEPSRMAREIIKVLKDAQWKRTMGERAREKALREYAPETYCQNILTCILRITSKASGTSPTSAIRPRQSA